MHRDASERFTIECENGHLIEQGARRQGEMERKVFCPECSTQVHIDFR